MTVREEISNKYKDYTREELLEEIQNLIDNPEVAIIRVPIKEKKKRRKDDYFGDEDPRQYF